jgi:hypothetical protein
MLAPQRSRFAQLVGLSPGGGRGTVCSFMAAAATSASAAAGANLSLWRNSFPPWLRANSNLAPMVTSQ